MASLERENSLIFAQEREGKSKKEIVSFFTTGQTRWNSTFYLLQRFLRLAQFLPKALLILRDKGKAPPLPSQADQKRLESLCQLLEMFETATLALEGDHLTLPLVPSILADLKGKLQSAAEEKDLVTRSQCAQLFLQAFEKRFASIFSENNLALQAAALHPTFGHLPWISDSLRDDVWMSLKKLGNQLRSSDESKIQISVKPFLRAIRKEFEAKPSRHVDDPLLWWKSHNDLSSLYPLVQYLWGIPASSSSAERLFSSLGHIVSHAPQRSPSTVKQLALLREYQKQPSYDFQQLLKAVNEQKDEILSGEK